MVKGFKYFRVLFTTEGRMKHDMDRRSGAVLALMQERDGCEKEAKPDGEALYLLINPQSNFRCALFSSH